MARQSNTREYIEDRILSIANRDDAESVNITIAELRTLLHHAQDKLSLMDQVAELQDEVRRLEESAGE